MKISQQTLKNIHSKPANFCHSSMVLSKKMHLRQQGAALFMVMILILVMSILTFNSLKSTTLHTRLATNQLATERTFQAADSVLDRIFHEGQDANGSRFISAVLDGIQFDCLTSTEFKDDKCSAPDTFDSYGRFSPQYGNTLYSSSQTRYIQDLIATGYDTRAFSYKQFETLGAGFYDPNQQINFATELELNWKRFGPKNQFVRTP